MLVESQIALELELLLIFDISVWIARCPLESHSYVDETMSAKIFLIKSELSR